MGGIVLSRRRAERTTFRRWVAWTTLGELAAFSVPTTMWGLTAVAALGDLAAFPLIVAAGAGEGAALGWAQSRALRHDLPALDAGAWVRATAAAAALAWAIGISPSTFYDELKTLPPALMAVLGVAAGVSCLVRLLRHRR